MAAPSSSANPITSVGTDDEGPPSEALASLITQVSPNAPAPTARPVRPARGASKPKKKPSAPAPKKSAAAADAGGKSLPAEPPAPAGKEDGVEMKELGKDAKDEDKDQTGTGTDETKVAGKDDPAAAAAAGPEKKASSGAGAARQHRERRASAGGKQLKKPKASSTSKEAASKAKEPRPRSRSGFGRIFAVILPCVASPGHDFAEQDGKVKQPPSSAAAAATKDGKDASATQATPKREQSGRKHRRKDDAAAIAAGAAEETKKEATEPKAQLLGTPPSPAPTQGGTMRDKSSTPVPIASSADPEAGTVASESKVGVALPKEETGGIMSADVMPPGRSVEGPPGTPDGQEGEDGVAAEGEEEEEEEDDGMIEDEEEDEDDIVRRGGAGIPIIDGVPTPLLPELSGEDIGRKCLVLDLDETLVHSSFKQMIHQADFVVPVEIENQVHNVYVIKRPGVDRFLAEMGQIYEVVVFTASLSKYADPVLDMLDIHRVVKHRLFRESCYNHRGSYVKDLSQLGRPIGQSIIIDNSPASYAFHPNNAVPVSSWFNDPHDTELTDLQAFLTDLTMVDDVRGVLDGSLN